jgi:hypothetical protein
LHKLADVKGELNDLFRELGPLIAKANNLVSMGHSLDLSEAKKSETRYIKNEIEEWQKKLNKINSELNELSKHPDSQKRINCYLTNYYATSGGSQLGQIAGGNSGPTSGAFGQACGGLQGADMLHRNMQMNMEFLALQNQMQMESRQFNSVSNALKVRHDSAMAAVRNMK